ncbi:unnamed protein product [Caenorhabditis auriculariae]|uniref:EB domain-containing protein n=1 Tax=Caenorhabditis auriculariae TaxID=2777116 RepID=A0A8S1H1Q8_9PELO|nr:unnamed protein product [Caenorhabditis auriculariae]
MRRKVEMNLPTAAGSTLPQCYGKVELPWGGTRSLTRKSRRRGLSHSRTGLVPVPLLIKEDTDRVGSPSAGNVCMTLENLRPADNSSQFYECAPLGDEEIEGYGLGDKYLGVWHKRDCPKDHEFDEIKQRCIERRTFRRQQAACEQNSQAVGCSIGCSEATTIPTLGSSCDWRASTLQNDPASNAYFFQCSPTSPSSSCGEWNRQQCAPATIYSQELSVCVPIKVQNSCQKSEMTAVCNCASTNACPGVAQCENNVCCQQTETFSLNNLIQHQPPLCPGSYVPPLGSCNEQCPEYSACSPGIGCCPVAVNQQPQGVIPISLCPGSLSPPFGTCGSCPSGTICNQKTQMCCPTQQQPSTDIVYKVVLLCPDGTPATTPCSNGCAANNACFQGACCPINCPSGQNAVGFCSSGSCGSGSCYARTTCCQEEIRLPVCSNGQQSQRRCSVSAECGPNLECSNGGCCPMPFCPTGIQATMRCNALLGCAPGMSCMEGLCCPLPRCPNGIISLGTCSRTFDCGRMGVECANGACCPLPTCANNQFASQRCSTGCNNCCPTGQACTNGGCCPLPQCSAGVIAVSMCSGSCSAGHECVNNGCCPLPRCPSGLMAQQRCRLGIGCPPGNQCENGVCCPMPMCSSGSIASSVCGMANSCPIGYVCEGRGCCQEPLPLCPNGGRSAQRCYRGAECPPGYGCTPLGGCCLLSMEPVCPARSNAVCQCSPNNACPNGASCTMGTCCSSATAVFNQVPGTTCQASSQCNGYSNSCAQCVQGVCSCVNGAASNGASCSQITPTVLTLARNGCDQYGSPCKFLLSTARRRPIFAPTGNMTEQPLFFNVAARRKCVLDSAEVDADSTCLPNEKCIDGDCRMKLWPGEYGCSSDLECASRCPNTYCEKKKSDKNVAQCQCRNGMLLYGRCFSQCPQGFHESGAFCMNDDEDKFWNDASAQDNLKALLNAGQC